VVENAKAYRGRFVPTTHVMTTLVARFRDLNCIPFCLLENYSNSQARQLPFAYFAYDGTNRTASSHDIPGKWAKGGVIHTGMADFINTKLYG